MRYKHIVTVPNKRENKCIVIGLVCLVNYPLYSTIQKKIVRTEHYFGRTCNNVPNVAIKEFSTRSNGEDSIDGPLI